jgi:hypothetical protein
MVREAVKGTVEWAFVKRAPTRILFLITLVALGVFSMQLYAAENIATPPDTNSLVIVENAVVNGNETTVFFLTRPGIRDPEARNPCPLNYYSVKLTAGLPTATPVAIAKGVCGSTFQKSRLLDNGEALIIVRDRLERWRAGEQVDSKTFSSMDAVSKLGVTTDMMGGQFYDISPEGDVVLLIQSGGSSYDRSEYGDSSMVMSGLKPNGDLRWEERFTGEPTLTTVDRVWSAPGGSALLYLSSMANGLSDIASQLYFINASGTKTLFELNNTAAPFDLNKFTNPSQQNMSHEEALKQLAQQKKAPSESIDKLQAVARSDGGFDVLFHREGGEEGREGHFLYRISGDGTLLSEISLGNQISEHGLERWFDFYVEGGQLLLLSSAPVTQKVVKKVKRKWGQNIVSWIDLDTGTPTPRMIPLDQQYLEAALNAGDEGQQYLDGKPGSSPVLLTTLGDKPLVVSVGSISRRQVLRLHEADEQLKVYTEAFDEKNAKLAKEASGKQRKADREAQTQRMQIAEAEAAGMTLEQYNALSNAEQKEALIRSGGYEKMMKSMTEESQLAMQQRKAQEDMSTRQGAPAQQAVMPQDMNAQITAAMAQAQEQMANDPNVTPEMRAQMEAILSQMGQMPGGQSATAPAKAAVQKSTGEKTVAENALEVDSGMRGFIEYENRDGRLITLLIFDRKSGNELMKKDYPDGVIYEYVDFSQFKLPLEQIGVIYKEVAGMILEDLTPVVSQ